MAKQKFDLGDTLADVLGKVSGTDAAPEQIVLIALPLIDADKKNFYSLDGIEELAANIELVGLLDPIRVRENPDMPGRYLIVSGHRRRAALWTLYEEQPEKWSKVPSIVEPPAESPEMQELRLIYANANTRAMTSADLSAQAQRVELLLYKLKEQGVEFPGRMRDHVAVACKISATKLAELKVIREKLTPHFRKKWEIGDLPHTTAYRIAQETPDLQEQLADDCTKKGIDICKSPEWSINQWFIDRKAKLFRQEQKPEPTSASAAVDYAAQYEKELELLREAIRQQWLEPFLGNLSRGSLPANRSEAVDRLKGAYRHSSFWGADMWSYDGTPVGLTVRPPHDAKFLARYTDIFDQLALASIEELHRRFEDDRKKEKNKAAPAQQTEATTLQFRSGERPPETEIHAWCVFDCGGTLLQQDAIYVPHLEKWTFKGTGAGIDAACVAWYPLPEWEDVKK